VKFECSHCKQRLSVSSAAAGMMVRCPSCNNRAKVPVSGKTERLAWKEADPTNPNPLLSLGIGFALLLIWFGLLLPFVPPADKPIADYSTMQFIASLFYKHFVVSFLNTMFFTWAMSIIFLKHRKIRHQKAALLLDVLPAQLGKEIDANNVGAFIDHVYALPATLRDSLMVNRIRKALELFEIRQSVNDVREMMVSQSEIDSARIGGSYALVRAFLWGIPLLGFIGTVVGLSHAIGGMNFANVEDVGKIVGAINNVTSGLGTAFDATLLGLVLALTLNFPLNALAKQEDDNLHVIDAFCNEVLLPRLKESPVDRSGVSALSESLLSSIAKAHEEFLSDLGQHGALMHEYTISLDRRMEAFQKTVTQEFVAKTDELRARHEAVLKESTEQVAKHIAGLEAGIAGLNKVLQELGGKQILINTPKKRGWFGRG
jgi:biopolymer transport protein ExbB/TolQ/DNA-directed RNA polymerase subunit RPC12/RpoP